MVIIVAAMLSEVKDLIKGFKLIKEKPFNEYEGIINQKQVVVGISGIGKSNAASLTTHLINSYKEIEYILNIGIAGAHKLVKNESYIVDKASHHDVDLTIFDYEHGKLPNLPKWFTSDKTLINGLDNFKKANLLTGDSFQTKRLTDQSYLVDMEGASIYQVAHLYSIPVISLKVVSDLVETEEQIAQYQASEINLSQKLKEETYKIMEVLG